MKKKWTPIVIVLALVLLAIVIYEMTSEPGKKPNVVTHLGDKPVNEIFRFDQDVCPGAAVSFKNLDRYLRPYVEKDETVTVRLNWYKCNPPKVGDIVLYRFSWHREPVLKRIVAIGGDRVDMSLDPEGRGWNLVVNDKIFESSGRRYFVGVPQAPPPLKLYADANSKTLRPELVVVLSNFPPGENDSGYFGPVDIHDIVGRVEK